MTRRARDSGPVRAFTVRLPREVADGLELVAEAYGRSMSDEVSEALMRHLARRLRSGDIASRLQGLKDAKVKQLDELLDASRGDVDRSGRTPGSLRRR